MNEQIKEARYRRDIYQNGGKMFETVNKYARRILLGDTSFLLVLVVRWSIWRWSGEKIPFEIDL